MGSAWLETATSTRMSVAALMCKHGASTLDAISPCGPESRDKLFHKATKKEALHIIHCIVMMSYYYTWGGSHQGSGTLATLPRLAGEAAATVTVSKKMCQGNSA